MSGYTTFKQLTNALLSLGFKAQAKGQIMIYSKPDCDAVIYIPHEEAESPMLPQYVVAARETVFGKGIANKQDFDRLLGQSVAVELQASKKSYITATHRNKPKHTVSAAASSLRYRSKNSLRDKTKAQARVVKSGKKTVRASGMHNSDIA